MLEMSPHTKRTLGGILIKNLVYYLGVCLLPCPSRGISQVWVRLGHWYMLVGGMSIAIYIHSIYLQTHGWPTWIEISPSSSISKTRPLRSPTHHALMYILETQHHSYTNPAIISMPFNRCYLQNIHAYKKVSLLHKHGIWRAPFYWRIGLTYSASTRTL